MQVGTALDTVEQLVEEQSLDILSADKWVVLVQYKVITYFLSVTVLAKSQTSNITD